MVDKIELNDDEIAKASGGGDASLIGTSYSFMTGQVYKKNIDPEFAEYIIVFYVRENKSGIIETGNEQVLCEYIRTKEDGSEVRNIDYIDISILLNECYKTIG